MKYSSLPLERLKPWAYLNDVQLHGIDVHEDVEGKGGGLVATKNHSPSEVLLTIPRDLVLNKASVEDASRSDRHLREVLDALGSAFVQTPRIAVMVFLLLQLTRSNTELGKSSSLGYTVPLTDYVKFLPKFVPLPTTYNTEERGLLVGTSLDTALKQKLKRLELEFEHLRLSTQDINWCNDLWWSVEDGSLSLDDWKLVDTLYRSRALELPSGVGDSMVPVLDMANHSSDGKHNARFQLDIHGNVQLVTRDDSSIHAGEEVTIMYGCGGACEMIFSYGFLEHGAQSAREMFLELSIPDDDPLKRAKVEFARQAPGIRVYTDNHEQIKWESSFVWWSCVNQEDGLDFRVLQQNDGSTELKATWKDTTLNPDELRPVLLEDPLWDVFQLRAVVQVQGRVEMQGIELSLTQEIFDATISCGDVSPTVDTIKRLRDLEMELLAASFQSLDVERALLLDSEVVRIYLKQQDPDRSEGADDDDFS